MVFFDELHKHGNLIAFIDNHSTKISYQNLLKATDELAQKIDRRSLVFLIGSNTPESMVGYLAFLRSRAVPALLQKSISPHFFDRLLKLYQPEYVYLPSESVDVPGRTICKVGGYQLVKTSFSVDYSLSDSLALLLSTSGTTGSPKFVRLSYQNIASNTQSITQSLDLTPESRPITTLPMSYSYGLSIIHSHLYVGASIQLTESSLFERSFWDLVESNRITTFGGVPYIYEILKKLGFDKMDLPSLRYITQAGGKLNTELRSEFASICQKKGIKFFIMYGQTEATARMSVLPWDLVQVKAQSIGKAIPGGKFWLKSLHGKPVTSPESEGELVYEGENVGLGYANNRFDLNLGDENCGVLYTGDIARSDSEGFYTIVGRNSRFVKLFGNRVSLDEVEDLIQKGGYECACIGTDEKLKIYVTSSLLQKELEIKLMSLTGLNPGYFTCVRIQRLPRNESGKVQYSVLEDQVGS